MRQTCQEANTLGFKIFRGVRWFPAPRMALATSLAAGVWPLGLVVTGVEILGVVPAEYMQFVLQQPAVQVPSSIEK